MKKNTEKNINKKAIIVALAVIGYLILGFFVTDQMAVRMSEDYYTLLGTKALDLARMSARQLRITDKDVLDLKKMTYEEMLNHPLNKQLTAIFQGGNFSEEVKYSYLWVLLDKSEIKYTVSKEDAEYYGATAGAPLDIMWLLDVTVNKEEAISMGQADYSYYEEDQNRYSIARPYDFDLVNNPREVFFSDANEFGKVIVAYCPVYTIEDNFVGCLNVDIYYDAFEEHISNNRFNFSLIFIIPTIILSLVYLFIYAKRVKSNSIEVNTDPMTQLLNRRFLEKQFPKLVKEAYRNRVSLATIMLDIDFFKSYNDHYGHKAGDEVIIKVADAIKSVTRKGIDYVCRYGGEEIFILLPNTGAGGAEFVAQKIQMAVNDLKIVHEYSNAGTILTVSQGIYACIPETFGNEECDIFVECADKALYNAKTSGRNKYCLYEK